MIKRDDVFRYLEQIVGIFGLSVIVLCIFTFFAGDTAKENSTMFALGSKGLPLQTLAQYFLLSVLINTLRFILFTDGLISRVSLTIRTFFMFFSVALLTALFAWLFGWFPVNRLGAWGAYLASFGFFCMLGSYIMAWKTDRENKEMEEALKRLKEESKDKDEEE